MIKPEGIFNLLRHDDYRRCLETHCCTDFKGAAWCDLHFQWVHVRYRRRVRSISVTGECIREIALVENVLDPEVHVDMFGWLPLGISIKYRVVRRLESILIRATLHTRCKSEQKLLFNKPIRADLSHPQNSR